MDWGTTKVRLAGLVGVGKLAVLEGPLASAELVESWRLFEPGAVDAAIKRFERHARGLAATAPDRLVSLVYIAPEQEPFMVAEPNAAGEIAKNDIPRLEWPLLRPTHVHRNARVGSYLILDVSAGSKSITVRMVSKNPLGSRFDHKTYRYTFDGIGYARGGNYLLVNGDLVRTSTFDDARAELTQANANDPVTLRYAYDDGITLTGNTEFHKDRIAETRGTTKIYMDRPIGMVPSDRRFEFRWSSRQRVWYVPQSRHTLYNRAGIEEIAAALRHRGISTVNVDYVPPTRAPLPEPAPPAPQPHGWPPIPLDADADGSSREQQLKRLPRYGKDDYRWHRVRLSHPAETPVNGLATNIVGHVVVGYPPTAVLGPFWSLSIDGERWGRAEEEFAVVANRFHQEVVPTLEPTPITPRSEPTPSTKPPFDTEQLAAAWAAHVAERRSDELAWTNVPKTSCFTTDEDVTLCTAFQAKPIGTCPPSMAGATSKARQVMLCGDEDQVYYFGSIVDAKPESANMVQRKRARALAERPRPEFPAADDFVAQERFLDSLVPTRLVFRPSEPFKLRTVAVAPVHVRTTEVSSTIENWVKREVPAGATLEAQVVVGASNTMPLREFVDALGSKYVPYVGAATPETLGKLLEHADRDQYEHITKRLTPNDVQHGVFGGRSLYWLYDTKAGELLGPINAKGNLGTAMARNEILARETQPLPLPDTLPPGWTLDDAIVLSLIIRGQQRFVAWNAKTHEVSSRADGDWSSPSPLPLRADWEATSGFSDFAHKAPYTLLAALDQQPGNVRFRVAGRWLGVVFPSDFDARVVFDPPTGGELELDQLAGDIATYAALLEQKPDEWALQQWVKAAPKRVAWAKRYLREHQPTSTVKKSRKSSEITDPQRQLLRIAANAWIDAPGSSTNFNGRKEIGVAESLIDAGYLAQTDAGTSADQPYIKAKLTRKGRTWVLEHLSAVLTPENIQQLQTARSGERSTMKKPATPKPAPELPTPAPAPKLTEEVAATPKKRAARKKSGAKKAAKTQAMPKKPAAPKRQTGKKKSGKKKAAAKKPNWHYTTHHDVRHRFRELDGQFVVERSTKDGWAAATAAAAKSIHAKSESACALAARILPTCGPQRPGSKPRSLRPSAAEKEAMRRFLGL